MPVILPSLPFAASASLPELIWVLASLIGSYMAASAWLCADQPRTRLKNVVRTAASGMFLLVGVIAVFTPPPVSPTWLSVLTPMAIAFGVTAMALLSVIDEQVN